MPAALIFSGQGAPTHRVGDPWQSTPEWALVDAIAGATGIDVAHLLLDATEDELVHTANAQVATFAFCAMVHAALATSLPEGIVAAAGGHSLGEYTALVASGVLELDTAARTVAERGAAMAAACAERPGMMAALIGLDAPTVLDICAAVDGDVWVANDNAPGQVVVAGTVDAVGAAGDAARAAGARRPMRLKVAGAFHTELMASAQARLDDALEAADREGAFADPAVTMWSNVDAAPHPERDEWPELLSAQLCSPIRWREQIEAMAASGIDTFVEVGPGTVLTGMVKRIAPATRRLHAATPDEAAAVASQLAGGAG